jgi:hypothetical protein
MNHSWNGAHPQTLRLNKIGISVLKVHLGMRAAPVRAGQKPNTRGYHYGLVHPEVLRVGKIDDLVEVIELVDVVARSIDHCWKEFPAAINYLKGL